MTDHYYTENPHSKVEKNTITYTFQKKTFTFTTSSGVFSKERIDYGSRVLIDAFEEPEINGSVLDLGCGYGPIGILLASQFINRTITMVDVNERALRLAEQNCVANNVGNIAIVKSDGLKEVANQKFAAIITNPPIRQGKKVIYHMFEQASKSLLPGGELWVVIQKKQGAPSALAYLQTLFSKAEIVKKDKGYYVIVAS